MANLAQRWNAFVALLDGDESLAWQVVGKDYLELFDNEPALIERHDMLIGAVKMLRCKDVSVQQPAPAPPWLTPDFSDLRV